MPHQTSTSCLGWQIALLLAAVMMCSAEALAATVAVVNRPNCHVRLDGDFTKGDDKRLEAAERRMEGVFDEHAKKRKLDFRERDILVCLNSTGGDPEAANAVIEYIRKAMVIGTVVDDGDKCHGLCALVFMTGRAYEHHTITNPNRNLHPRGELSFHVPYRDAKGALVADRAFGDGVRQVARIMGMDDKHTRLISPVIPRALLARMLINGPDKALGVETVADAHAWNIDLIDTRKPSAWTHGMLQRACHYKDSEVRGTDIAATESVATPDPPVVLKGSRLRTIFSGFGQGGRDKCFVDLYRSDHDGIFLHVTIAESAEAEGMPKAEDLAAQVTSWLQRGKQSTEPARHSIPTCCMSPTWKVHPGTTKISTLAK